MIVDMHYHLEPRLESVTGLLAQMQQQHVDRVALIAPGVGLVDFHGRRALARLLPWALRGPFARIGMGFYDRTLTDDQHFSVLGTRYEIYDSPDNASIGQVLAAQPDKFYGWVFVNPRQVEPLAELARWLPQPGWIGVKALPFWHRYSLAALDDVAAWCADRGWPLLIHLGNRMANGDWRYLPERHPRLKLIYAHTGVPFYREVWEYVLHRENIWVDLSNPVYVDTGARLGALKRLGAERCLYGTDGPYAGATQARMLEKIYRLPLSDREKELILGGNFVGLCDLLTAD